MGDTEYLVLDTTWSGIGINTDTRNVKDHLKYQKFDFCAYFYRNRYRYQPKRNMSK